MSDKFEEKEHNHECECGCGHDHDHDHESEIETITLTLDDDSELECGILGVFDVPTLEGEYIALITLEENQVLLYRYKEDESEEEAFELGSIETDEEFEKVSATFNEIFVDEDAEEE